MRLCAVKSTLGEFLASRLPATYPEFLMEFYIWLMVSHRVDSRPGSDSVGQTVVGRINGVAACFSHSDRSSASRPQQGVGGNTASWPAVPSPVCCPRILSRIVRVCTAANAVVGGSGATALKRHRGSDFGGDSVGSCGHGPTGRTGRRF